MSLLAPILWAIPWLLPPLIAVVRARHSRSLNDISAEPGNDPLTVSVVIPARNEARNIATCASSVLASHYAALDVIVVDDHSSDGTGDIARRLAAGDSRLRVIDAPPLPPGWFGKQWACSTGATQSAGDILLFTDADTIHAPDLLPRAVNALRERAADLLSVAGRQEMRSFWERVIQPQIFALLAMRYGGAEHVSNARRAEDVIANGQYILTTRKAYDAMGGHASVRDVVAEDLALAQRYFRAGKRVALVMANDQFATHMYAGLREIVRGWRKNIYAGGRYAMWGGRVGRVAYPVLLGAMPLANLLPPLVLILSAVGAFPGTLTTSWLIWSALVTALSLLFWAAVYRFVRQPLWYALLYPLGLAMFAYIAIGSVARGQQVEWKSRNYRSG